MSGVVALGTSEKCHKGGGIKDWEGGPKMLAARLMEALVFAEDSLSASREKRPWVTVPGGGLSNTCGSQIRSLTKVKTLSERIAI